MGQQQQLLKTSDVLVRVLSLDPTEKNPWHYHTLVDDIIVCLSGCLTVRSRNPDHSITLVPGQRTIVPAGMVHQVVNQDDTESEYLIIQGVGSYDFIRVEST